MSRIFLSHSSRDSVQAMALKRWLEGEEPGLIGEVFLDLDPITGIAPGERWKQALRQANERCEVVICLLSLHWEASRECLAEYRHAESLGKLILCARLEPLHEESVTGEWQRCDLFGSGPTTVIPIEVEGQQQTVVFAVEGLVRLRNGLRRAGISAEHFPWPPPQDPVRAPYRGWEPLEEADAAVFFGRDAQIVRALDALRGMRGSGIESLFAVVGPSGSGKSSFLRAGLVPRLRREDRQFLVLDTVRPERHVLTGEHGVARSVHRLRARLGLRTPGLGQIKEACVRGEVGRLRGWLAEARQAARDRVLDVGGVPLPTAVVPLDQAEELFSVDAGAEGRRFLGLAAGLMELGQGAVPEFIVVGTIRSDFYEALQSAPELAGVKSILFPDLKPLPIAQFKEVILGPAARATAAGQPLQIAPALVDRLLEDSGQGADTLPLLSLTLARLYEDYGGDGTLTLDHYRDMGGMERVVQNEIDSLLSADPVLRHGQKSQLRSAFIPWLATINPDNDQPVRRIARFSDLPVGVRPLVEAMVERRLLVRDERGGEAVVEVALESLLRQWGDLSGWLEAEREDLKEADVLERAAAAWKRSGRNQDWLLEGDRLTGAERLAAKPAFRNRLDPARSLLHASRTREDERAAAERKRREEAELRAAEALAAAEAQQHAEVLRKRSRILRAVLGGTVVVALAAILGFVLAVSTQRVATDRARESTALQLAAEGQARLAGARPGGEILGMHQMLASQALKPTAEGERALASSVVVQHDVYKLIPVGSSVQAVAYAPDGRLVASGDDGGAVRLWDAATGQPAKAPLVGHEAPVRAVAFSPDGQRLASAGDDGSVRLWDTGSGQPVGAPLTGHEGAVHAVTFSPDGQRLASGGADGTVRLWDAATGQPVGAPMAADGDPVNAVAISPAGQLIASGGDDNAVRLWNAATGQPVAAPMTGHEGAVHAVAFDGDGRRIASAGHDRTVRLWDADTARPVGEPLRGHKNWVSDVAFSPDGQRLVSGGADSDLLLWDTQTGQAIGDPLTGHGQEVFSAVFSPDGERIVSGMGDGTIRLWDAKAPVPMLHGLWVLDLDVSADGRLIASTGVDKIVRLWDAATDQPVGEPLTGHQDAVNGVAFSPDGRLIATASADQTVRLWDVATRRQPGSPLVGHEGAVLDVAFSPDGRLLATTGADQTVRLWDVQARRQRGSPLTGHEGAVNAVAFSPDGALIASAGADGTVRLWDVDGGQPAGEPLTGHEGEVFDVAFSPNGNRIASVGEDKMVRLWTTQTRQQQGAALAGHEAAVRSVAFSPDGRRVASGSDDWQVRLWDAQTGAGIGNPLIGHGDVVDGLAFTPDTNTVVSGSWDRNVRTWPVPPDPSRALCAKLTQNLSQDQWRASVSSDVGYVATCPDLPIPEPVDVVH